MTQTLEIVQGLLRKSILSQVMMCCILIAACMAASKAQSITVGGTAPKLNVTTALPGSEPSPVVSTSSRIVYSSGGGRPSKVTVMTSCPNQKFSLTVVAGAIPANGGTAAPAVSLVNGMLATDFITSIKKNSGPFTVTLQYTTTPLMSQGTGTDSHTVTYTVTQ
jgi:hypothetical protein